MCSVSPPLLANLFPVGPLSHYVTIETLSDDILLNIFHHYLSVTPKLWPTLALVCQRWRYIIYTSPLGLNLRLYCTHGTPVLKTLDCWPVLPIAMQYGGVPKLDPPAPEDDDNIIAALKQSGRVRSISLTITSSLLEKLSTIISEPFLDLEELALLSQHNVQLTLPSTFRWGSRLHTLHSTGIALPSFPHLLSPCQDLADLQLHEIPSIGYFSPETFANALSGMTRLRSISLHLLSFPRRRSYVGLPPLPGERIVLPALTRFKYRGASKYLDSFVARIDAPHLGDIDITFFSQPTMDSLHLGQFLERMELQTSLTQAHIQASENAISISFTNSTTSSRLQIRMSCKQLDWQLSSMAQILNQFSHFLFRRIENLGFDATGPASGQDDIDGEQWLALIRVFEGTKDFRVAGIHVPDILCALCPASITDAIVLPSLHNLHLPPKPLPLGPLWDAVQSFIASRSSSRRPVLVKVPSYQCHLCPISFEQQQGLKRHLRDEHAYRIVCIHCSDFEYALRHNERFREHLQSEHPEVARNDAHISSPSLTPSQLDLQLDAFFNRHSSLRAPDIIATPALF